jgi:hypothetical protein
MGIGIILILIGLIKCRVKKTRQKAGIFARI